MRIFLTGATGFIGSAIVPELLKAGAATADGVIHTAFDHDFSRFVANCEKDKRAIEALGSVLAGSKRPLVITSGTAMGSLAPDLLATEEVCNTNHPHPRATSSMSRAYTARPWRKAKRARVIMRSAKKGSAAAK
ncbi:hypothetical protein [Pseudomonas sp. MWU13-2105]|uniref:hypothetical protein n=1 Tax=Pseudomonas sp. MWU13-2105 TaxID=2935074 RepID=UPI00200D250E|nr:hypothetical protein [Pseudomonas sp. MWU13-2105]